MPRKRKAVQSQLPPLLFVNSPDFQPVPVLTPDMAVDNPITARPVPVENLIDSTWVSPQFRNCRELSKCQNSRRNNHCVSHTLTHARLRTGEYGNNEDTRKLKFKPLIFFNDNNSYSKMPTVSFTDVTSIDMNNIVVHTPNIQHRHERDSENVNPMGSCNAVIDSGVIKCHDRSQDIQATPTRSFHRDRTDIHKLVKPNNLFSVGSLNSKKLKQFGEPGNLLGNVQIFEELNNSEMQEENILNTPSNGFSCLPSKNDSGLANQLPCLISRTPPASKNNSMVLVVDTPECDYSLTFRQRQLKYR
ncbi:hypothetical protein BsWGS_19185 [Bradybaena similaris]